MKKTVLLFAAAWLFAAHGYAQEKSTTISSRNSWLKFGANVGVPVGNASDYSNATLGLELKGQVLETRSVGIGLMTGYTHFFAKDNFEDFGIIPLDAFIRYYPKSRGIFI